MSEHGGGADDRASWSARPQEPATKPGTIPSSSDGDGAAKQPELYSLKILGTELTAKQTQQLIIALCVHTARSIRTQKRGLPWRRGGIYRQSVSA